MIDYLCVLFWEMALNFIRVVLRMSRNKAGVVNSAKVYITKTLNFPLNC
jgi:hypothetical protein